MYTVCNVGCVKRGCYLLLGLEDVAPEAVIGAVSGDEAEDLQVLGIMRHVEDSGRKSLLVNFLSSVTELQNMFLTRQSITQLEK